MRTLDLDPRQVASPCFERKARLTFPSVCWVDHLNFTSLLRLLGLRWNGKRGVWHIRYLTANPWAIWFTEKYLKRYLKIQSIVLYRREGIGETNVLNKLMNGHCGGSLVGDFSKLTNELLAHLNHGYDRDKICYFLEQELVADLDVPVKLVDLMFNHIAVMRDPRDSQVILIKSNDSLKALQSYCDKMTGNPNSIRFATYWDIKELLKSFYYPLRICFEIAFNAFLILAGKGLHQSPPSSDKPKVAVLYAHGTNINQKCDYFWFPNSGIPPAHVLLYFKHHSHPPQSENIKEVESLGIPWINLLPKRIDFRPFLSGSFEMNQFPSIDYVKRLFKTLLISSKILLGCLARGNHLLFWFWPRLTQFFHDVILFESFFSSYNVKVHYAAYETGRHMSAANLAIDQLGGVDLCHHWSHLDYAERRLGKPHDVYFAWGPFYKRHFFDSGYYRVYNYVFTGYVYDYCFNLSRKKAFQHRQTLGKWGAQFIVSFFDQSVSKTPSLWNEAQENLYRHLLNNVLKRPDFGLVIKSKKASGLRGVASKFPRLTEVLDQAVASGRCLILNESSPPAEAAQASDLVIGMGASSTPALEAALAGIPSITYNAEHQTNHPLYERGKNKIIFDDIKDILTAIERAQRKEPLHELGDLSFALSEIDPFRDGMARMRVGSYIKCLFDALGQGTPKEEAIEFANSVYRKKYGYDKVENGSSLERATEARMQAS